MKPQEPLKLRSYFSEQTLRRGAVIDKHVAEATFSTEKEIVPRQTMSFAESDIMRIK